MHVIVYVREVFELAGIVHATAIWRQCRFLCDEVLHQLNGQFTIVANLCPYVCPFCVSQSFSVFSFRIIWSPL